MLIADDHGVVREGLVAMIGRQEEMMVVAQAANGAEAVELWRSHRPDITLLDLRMPVLDGVGAIGQIRAEDPKARILILTTYDGDEDIYRGMRAGAKAYLLKDTPREELLQCIRAVYHGESYIPPAVAAKLASQVSGERLTDSRGRDPHPDGARQQQQGDRARARHQRGHRQDPRQEHPAEARRHQPDRGGVHRRQARAGASVR